MPDRLAVRILITCLILFLFNSAHLYAHSGDTDSQGGHYNPKTGGHHYHSVNKTTTAEITSRHEDGGKTATRSTKMFVVGNGSIGVRKERAELFTTYSFKGQVIVVHSGDTIKVLNNGKQVKVRLYGISTPEKKKDFGKAAKHFTRDMVAGKTVVVESIDTDRHGRTLGIVTIDGVSLNEELVRSGHAWVYDRYCKKSFCSDWNKLEAEARSNVVGLWKDRGSKQPWGWRREKMNK